MQRCSHGVYDPHGDGLYCQMCNPATNDVAPAAVIGDTPKFNRRNALSITETGKLPKCPSCGGHSILTVSLGGQCSICHAEYDLVAPAHLRANNKQPGICPNCQSGVHFEVSTKLWKCADCDTQYKAPKRLE